jgi:predicted phage terminase large subunit-like protein
MRPSFARRPRTEATRRAIGIEQEPGAAGLALGERYTRHLLRGYRVFAERVTGGKLIRAQPVAAAAENGLIKLVRGRHSEELLDELTAFPHGAHDDCVDALSGAHSLLVRRGSGQMAPRAAGADPLAHRPYSRRYLRPRITSRACELTRRHLVSEPPSIANCYKPASSRPQAAAIGVGSVLLTALVARRIGLRYTSSTSELPKTLGRRRRERARKGPAALRDASTARRT